MNDRKKTRSESQETTLRKLVLSLTDRILEFQAAQTKSEDARKKDNIVMLARLQTIEDDVATVRKGLDALSKTTDKSLRELTKVVAEVQKHTNDLHAKAIDSSNDLGKRLYDLENERSTRGSSPRAGARTSRPPRGG
jgi:hypothetical protein